MFQSQLDEHGKDYDVAYKLEDRIDLARIEHCFVSVIDVPRQL